MAKKILLSFSLAFQNIRSHFFHTFLSVLGIVIGVAALVAILSLIDGMQKYANDQITQTTSLKAIMIHSETHKVVDDVRLKKDNYAYLNYNHFLQLKAALQLPANGYLRLKKPDEILAVEKNKSMGAFIVGTAAPIGPDVRLAYGDSLTDVFISEKQPVALVSYSMAKQIMGNDSLHQLIGSHLIVKGKELRVIGITAKNENQAAEVFIPITLFSDAELKADPPMCFIEAGLVENVPALRLQAEKWLKENFKENAADFRVITNDFRVKQAAQGFLLFRIVMGLIVGISVIVGGIGVMNVLLISVTERTSEIGVRKAVGAKKRDILLQFLSESITISAFGSLIGLVLGILATLIMVPIIQTFVKIHFEAAYTWNTFFIISAIAVLVGILFGTYPAMRAARLDPVDAIRRE